MMDFYANLESESCMDEFLDNLHDSFKNRMPYTFRSFFSIRETSYDLRGNCINLCLTKFSLMRNSFTNKCTQLQNKVPEDAKLANDVDVFKSKLISIQL